jgi:hypothetical protein
MEAMDRAWTEGTTRPPHDSQLVALLERRYSPLARAAMLRDVKPRPRPRQRAPRGTRAAPPRPA